jgi:hypothetical protein
MSSLALSPFTAISRHALDSVFETTEPQANETIVHFGDGAHGAALPLSSSAVLDCVYRAGSGASGNVAAGASQQGATAAASSMSEMGEMESLRLQEAMDRFSKMMSTLSNIVLKVDTTSAAITQNIK